MKGSATRLIQAMLVITCAVIASAQSIRTVAGGGIDDGRPATALGLAFPNGVAVDATGNIYIAERHGHRVRKVIEPSGIIVTLAGNGTAGRVGDDGPAVKASVWGPTSVAIDGNGNVYIAEGSSRVRKVAAATGVITTVVGTGVSGFSGDGGSALLARISEPESIALDGSGNLYIADGFNARIRRVELSTGTITTIAGDGSEKFSGDGGLAALAGLVRPVGVAVDAAGNVFIADEDDHRIRRVDALTGRITTVAGNGIRGYSGDGNLAIDAQLNGPASVAVDSSGDLIIAEILGERVRRVDATSGVIRTIAGTGKSGFSGDGGLATAARLTLPRGLAIDRRGAIYVADWGNMRVRRIEPVSGLISTVAGNGEEGFLGDGGPATSASFASVEGVAVDSVGNLYLSDLQNKRVRKVTAGTGLISSLDGPAGVLRFDSPFGLQLDDRGNLYVADVTRVWKVFVSNGEATSVAGGDDFGFSGDGGPATAARLAYAFDVAVSRRGDLYIADRDNHRVRRVDGTSGIITTFAGNGTEGFSGDGGPATAARLSSPLGVALDADNNVYIADTDNLRIRRVDVATGTITTVAGNGTGSFVREPVRATTGGLWYPYDLTVDSAGDLWIADTGHDSVRKVSMATGMMTTITGIGSSGFSGDGGPAAAAALNNPVGVQVDRAGNLFIADSFNNRVRAVFACVHVVAPRLLQPANDASGEKAAPRLQWSPVSGALSYDILLDTSNPPTRVVATDVALPTYNPSNLEALTTYYWRVIAKGDPFCTPASASASEVRTFTTAGSCGPPGAFSAEATVIGEALSIRWQPSARAASYDVYAGAVDPPPLYARGVTATSRVVTDLAAGTTYYWKVVARASCDSTRIAETAVATASIAGACAAPAPFAPMRPAVGEIDVPAEAAFTWQPSQGAASYDFHLGTDGNPPLYASGLLQAGITIPRLEAGISYTWKVVARASCDPSASVATAVRRFTVRRCATPSAPLFESSVSSVKAGATYVVRWSDVPAIDDGGTYRVERARDPAFTTVIDRQETRGTAAAFLATSSGTYYHRVRAVAGCGASHVSSPSASLAMTVTDPAPIVIFTALPQAVITTLGDRLEDQKTTFALENLGTQPVQVLVGAQLISSTSFFRIVDPLGGDAAFVTLEPRVSKSFEIRFSGPPNDRPGAYQGGIYVVSAGEALAFTPQALVSLKVGGDAGAAAPSLLVEGAVSETVSFPPFGGDDAARPSMIVDLLNDGVAPLDVAAEIGPEAWLTMEKDWNATAVPGRAFRPLRLSTQRTRAVAGSALPRYTYLTVRNKFAAAARLLVIDPGSMPAFPGRTATAPAVESAVVPWLTSGGVLVMTNLGADAAPVDLIYTPSGADGFDATRVRRASIVIPPNDVVCLTDAPARIFGAVAGGLMELRSEKLSQLVLRAPLPIAWRGEGARLGSPHRVAGLGSIILAETTGRGAVTARLVSYDSGGKRRGEQIVQLPRFGSRRIDDFGGWFVDVEVVAGGGAVMAVDLAGGAAYAGRALDASGATTLHVPGVVTDDVRTTTIGVAGTTPATVVFRDFENARTVTRTLPIGGETTLPKGKGIAVVTGPSPLIAYARVTTNGARDALPVVSMMSFALTGGESSVPLIADGLELSLDPARGVRTALILSEISGRNATVTVRLYDPGTRGAAVAEKNFVVPAGGEVRLEDLFAAMGLQSEPDARDQRRKDRVNVAVVVTAAMGGGVVSAQTVATDKRTGAQRTIELVPAGGVAATFFSKAPAPRRRAVPY